MLDAALGANERVLWAQIPLARPWVREGIAQTLGGVLVAGFFTVFIGIVLGTATDPILRLLPIPLLIPVALGIGMIVHGSRATERIARGLFVVTTERAISIVPSGALGRLKLRSFGSHLFPGVVSFPEPDGAGNVVFEVAPPGQEEAYDPASQGFMGVESLVQLLEVLRTVPAKR